MILDDFEEIIDNAKCPEIFPEDLNIGECMYLEDDSQKLFEWSPENNCDAFAHIKEYKDDAGISIHTHGICVEIGDTKINIHNSQIVVFDYWHFDDTIEYKRSDTRGARIATGLLLAGPILGAAVGLAASFGRGRKHVKYDNVVIAFWDIKTKGIQIINLQEPNDSKPGSVKKMIEYWKNQIKINEETGRKPIGNNLAGVGEAGGCLPFSFVVISPLLVAMYKLIETLIC